MIDWKRLFAAMGVDWRDRGPNTTRNDVNICCPFCGDDYGYHLGVAISGNTRYFCFRNPEHGGRSPVYLLRALGATGDEAEQLVEEFGDGEAPVERSAPTPGDITPQWRRFLPAADDADCMAYLESRGFPRPELVARKFDLRFSPYGKWARRLIMPVKLNNRVVSWTARSIDEHRRPKYLLQSVVFPGLVYVPKVSRDTMVAVEGPLDALKVAATDMDHVGAFALMGKALNSRKLIILTKLLQGVRKIVFAPDADVEPLAAERMRKQLSLVRFGGPQIAMIRPPPPFKDAGAMPINAIRPWVNAA